MITYKYEMWGLLRADACNCMQTMYTQCILYKISWEQNCELYAEDGRGPQWAPLLSVALQTAVWGRWTGLDFGELYALSKSQEKFKENPVCGRCKLYTGILRAELHVCRCMAEERGQKWALLLSAAPQTPLSRHKTSLDVGQLYAPFRPLESCCVRSMFKQPGHWTALCCLSLLGSMPPWYKDFDSQS